MWTELLLVIWIGVPLVVGIVVVTKNRTPPRA